MKIQITPEAYMKLVYYIQESPDEISGFGSVENSSQGFLITDIFIFEQTVSAADTDIDKDDLAEFLMKYDEEGGDISKIKVWWHSHGDMGSFFSNTDTDTIAMLGETFNWLISIVGNHDLKFESRLDIFKIEGAPLDITKKVSLNMFAEDENLKKQIIKEIKEKVKEVYKYTETRFNKSGFSSPGYKGYNEFPRIGPGKKNKKNKHQQETWKKT